MRPDDIVLTDRLVTIKQLIADHCPVSDDLVRHWVRHEGLPCHRGSKKADSQRGRILIRVSEFYDWMDKRRAHRGAVMNSASQEAREVLRKVLA